MTASLEQLTTGEVTVAVKDATIDGLEIEEGSFFGLVSGSAVATGPDLVEVALDVVLRAADGRDFARIVTGENAPSEAELRRALGEARPDLELEVIDGGQPHYPLLVVAQ
jgi:dihydroxyacetone kinase-like predicted kinase